MPWPVIEHVGEQLGTEDVSCIKRYTEWQMTAYEHAWEIRDAYGYHPYDDPEWPRRFRTFLHGRAWTHAEGPVALFNQAVGWLRRNRVAAGRERVRRLDQAAAQLGRVQPHDLREPDPAVRLAPFLGLVEARETGGVTLRAGRRRRDGADLTDDRAIPGWIRAVRARWRPARSCAGRGASGMPYSVPPPVGVPVLRRYSSPCPPLMSGSPACSHRARSRTPRCPRSSDPAAASA